MNLAPNRVYAERVRTESRPIFFRFFIRRLNKLRWLCLWSVFLLLLALPSFHVYQTNAASHAYDLLTPQEQSMYDTTEWVALMLTTDPEHDLDKFKGTTWSGTLFGYSVADPLALLSQLAASKTVYWPFVAAILVPLLITILLGRVFCGWICPATLMYELNDNMMTWLRKVNRSFGARRFDTRIKYGILAAVLLLCGVSGSVVTALIYPPAVLGRELYSAVVMGGFSAGIVFIVFTLLFDALVAKRGFCRYLCPGGALYSVLGRYRLLRIQRSVDQCNDCCKCDASCQFGLSPMSDRFGQECNNCTGCIAACPSDALNFKLLLKDLPYKGPGHLGKAYRQHNKVEPSACKQY